MRILFVIDLQPEVGCDKDYQRLIDYIRKNKKRYDKIIATKFSNASDGPFIKYLNWKEMKYVKKLAFQYDLKIPKNSYGLRCSLHNIFAMDDTITVIGRDTDSTIMKIAFDLFDENFDFQVLSDYCYSKNGIYAHEQALQLMKYQFGTAIQ